MKTSSKFATLSAIAVLLGASTLAHAETTGQYVDDATITTKVKAALVADSHLKSMHISVETNQGVVALGGIVNTAHQESAAVKDANQVDGVKSVTDNMTLKGAQ